MKRILIVNVNWLGDTLFVTPFIRAIRDSYPDSYIAILTHPRCEDILERNSSINEIILFNEKDIFSLFAVLLKLRSKKFDTAFILKPSFSRAMLLYLSNIRDRIGFYDKKSAYLLTKKVKVPTQDLHKVDMFLELGKAVGIMPRTKDYEFFIKDEDKKEIDKILFASGINKDEEFVVMNPGGNWGPKRWPKENFARLGDEIQNKLKVKAILTGAKKDIELCNEIADKMAKKPILLCGKTSLRALAALFEKARLVISNDSGPMHLAVAVKARTLALFGPTDPAITGPYGGSIFKVLKKDIGCKVPCYETTCKDNLCMKAISVEEVFKEIS